MIEVEEATERIIGGVQAGAGIRVPIVDATGCFARGSLLARHSIPGSDQSAVDGFAVSHTSDVTGAEFSVVGEVPAGQTADEVKIASGEAARVFTGAQIPDGVAAVVMQEDVEVSPSGKRIKVEAKIQQGDWIRKTGSALCKGQRIIGDGDR